MDSLSVIITSFHQEAFTLNCIKSYNYFCPSDLKLNLVVVENSKDTSYKEKALALGNNVVWVNNDTHKRGADANAHGIIVGLENTEDEYVFLSHNDACITGQNFFNVMREKVSSGYKLIGTCYDTHPARNHSIIVLGCLVQADIARTVDLYPLDKPDGTPYFEVGDRIHIYCRDNSIKHVCLKNTHNNPEIESSLKEPFRSLPYTLKTIDDNGGVIFLHFARGTTKTQGTYQKQGRFSIPQIIKFCETNLFI